MNELGPPLYFPWVKGVYDVSPGLRPFGTDFGNGHWDQKFFQLTPNFETYSENKRSALRERRSKYVRAFRLSREVESEAIELIVNRLCSDYPDKYQAGQEGNHLTLQSEGKTWVLPALGRESGSPALDFLARLVQEDLVVVCRNKDLDWTAYMHVCSLSHWGVEDKIGTSFFDVHLSIPGFESVNAVSSQMVEAMIQRGPFVRFVWGLESDNRLNHHPEPPPDFEPQQWQGRNFKDGRFWVRTERQVIFGLPQVDAALFTIGVGFVEDSYILQREELRQSLQKALATMSPQARKYKGLDRDWDRLQTLLTP